MKKPQHSKKSNKAAYKIALLLILTNAALSAQSTLCSSYPTWAQNSTYNANDKVIYNDTIYTARWYVQNTAPDKPGAAVWKNNGACILVNQDPTVSLSSPLDNDGYASGSTIPITAVAADVDGKIDTVFFYEGNTLIGTDVYAPFSLNWIGAPDGVHQITAVAKDNNGATVTSTIVTISISGLTSIFSLIPENIQTYPNPSNGIYYFNANNETFFHFQVTNIIGEIIQKSIVSSGLNTIDLSAYNSGTYYLTLLGGDSVHTQKLVLSK
jgi:chitodextrinase